MGPERFELSTLNTIYNKPLVSSEDRSKDLDSFKVFCRIDLQLADSTASRYVREIERFLEFVGKDPFDVLRDDIRAYLVKFKEKSDYAYGNVLRPLKIYFRDFLSLPELVSSFRFPRKRFEYRGIPSREEIKRFYESLDTIRDKALFLMYATTGLRKSEVLSLRIEDIDFQKRMVIPRKNQSRTKHTWITFYNEETEKVLKDYLAERKDSNPKLFPMRNETFCRTWRKAKDRSGVDITPQVLRRWFATEMARLRVPDRYVDAFCGRVPKSVLARHYSDYSPETLKEIYENAGLQVLS